MKNDNHYVTIFTATLEYSEFIYVILLKPYTTSRWPLNGKACWEQENPIQLEVIVGEKHKSFGPQPFALTGMPLLCLLCSRTLCHPCKPQVSLLKT